MSTLSSIGDNHPERSQLSRGMSRRAFLKAAAATVGTLCLPRGVPAIENQVAADDRVAFFLIGDTHYYAPKETPLALAPKSVEVTSRFVDVLNRLPGTEIPTAVGGGAVQSPKGVIHAGDMIDSADVQTYYRLGRELSARINRTEWTGFVTDFGLTGVDGKLKFPVYEVHGNHDAPFGTELVVKEIAQRNRRRSGVTNISANGVHYSWDWGNVHFINLGIVVGSLPGDTRKRRYNALESLAFLTEDLREKVDTSGRPVVITHHVDFFRNNLKCTADPNASTYTEWDPCDVRGFYWALQKYNILAICHGHTHKPEVWRWDGTRDKNAGKGFNILNVGTASHYGNTYHDLFYIEITNRELVVREYRSTDRWLTGSWNPKVWKAPVSG